jgi:ABC-type transport system substrate-binding protein
VTQRICLISPQSLKNSRKTLSSTLYGNRPQKIVTQPSGFSDNSASNQRKTQVKNKCKKVKKIIFKENDEVTTNKRPTHWMENQKERNEQTYACYFSLQTICVVVLMHADGLIRPSTKMNQSNENSKKNLLKCVIVCGSV